jgi:hypothetical protein
MARWHSKSVRRVTNREGAAAPDLDALAATYGDLQLGVAAAAVSKFTPRRSNPRFCRKLGVVAEGEPAATSPESRGFLGPRRLK